MSNNSCYLFSKEKGAGYGYQYEFGPANFKECVEKKEELKTKHRKWRECYNPIFNEFICDYMITVDVFTETD